MNTAPRRLFLQLFSLAISGLLLLVIFSVHVGVVGSSHVLPTILTLAIAVALRYVAVYHQFSKRTYRRVLLIPIGVAGIASGVTTTRSLVAAVTFEELRSSVRRGSFQLQYADFLPEWWIVVILLPAATLILVGSVLNRDFAPFEKPTRLGEVATSPVYFGTACTVFGLWAVLFVGVGVQRIVVIAPFFEELLKFGVALLVGSALFGRSFLARIGVAIVVGSLFGIIEHAVTYPMEADAVYLFRTFFHMVTTTLSVAVYTRFERRGDDGLLWIAPAYPVVLHFFYNTFNVLWGVISLVVYGSQVVVVPLAYGGAAILVAGTLLVLVAIRHDVVAGLHLPIEQVLSDLV